MFGSTASNTSIDPDQQRAAPPLPTVVYFPQGEIQLTAAENWQQHPPNLYKPYAYIAKPLDVRLKHLADLNLTVENDVTLETFIPVSSNGAHHLPPKAWLQQGPVQAGRSQSIHVFSHHKHLLLNNGHKAPDQELFFKYAQELMSNTEDALRVIGHRKAPPGRSVPQLNHFRRFWSQLEIVSQYWDCSKDNYFEVDAPADSARSSTDKTSRRSSLSNRSHFPDPVKHEQGKLYTGFRISTGSRMPEKYRIESVKALMENIVWAFGCQMSPPRRTQHLQVENLLIPVTQSSMIWRTPADKSQAKIGIMEGPVLGVQARNETAFLRDSHMALTDTARELAGLLLLAEERAREKKKRVIPGEGQWYTTKPRWGGGPGGDFGDVEHRQAPTKPHYGQILGHSKPSDEEVWKQLKPGPGLWEPRITYAAVGKDKQRPQDYVFMISALFHHVSLLRLEVHPDYVKYLETGLPPNFPDASEHWYMPTVQRTRWYDLLDSEDRGELLRGIWGILSYSMRTETVASGRPAAPQRQHSDSSHFFSFRKKATPAPHEETVRSHSIH